MDLPVALVFFCELSLLALRYGHDNRDARAFGRRRPGAPRHGVGRSSPSIGLDTVAT
jgi:hypothetical protein